MRGRTLDAFIILDEAQNSTTEQMKMFLTRLGDIQTTTVYTRLTQNDLQKIVNTFDAARNQKGI